MFEIKNLTEAERIDAFSHEFALILRRITGRTVDDLSLELPQPVLGDGETDPADDLTQDAKCKSQEEFDGT